MSNTRNWEVIKAYEDIHFEFFEGIARITIDRQEVYNACLLYTSPSPRDPE